MLAARKSPPHKENIRKTPEGKLAQRPSSNGKKAKSSLKVSPKSSQKSVQKSQKSLDVAAKSPVQNKDKPKKNSKGSQQYDALGGASFDDVLEKLGLRRIKAPMA
jgi:hypothetical protein